MTARIVRRGFLVAVALAVLATSGARGQGPTGIDLALVDMDGTKRVVGQLPPSVYAPRISPDGKRVAFETRDTAGPDGARLWTAVVAALVAPITTRLGRAGRELGGDRRRRPLLVPRYAHEGHR